MLMEVYIKLSEAHLALNATLQALQLPSNIVDIATHSLTLPPQFHCCTWPCVDGHTMSSQPVTSMQESPTAELPSEDGHMSSMPPVTFGQELPTWESPPPEFPCCSRHPCNDALTCASPVSSVMQESPLLELPCIDGPADSLPVVTSDQELPIAESPHSDDHSSSCPELPEVPPFPFNTEQELPTNLVSLIGDGSANEAGVICFSIGTDSEPILNEKQRRSRLKKLKKKNNNRTRRSAAGDPTFAMQE